MDIKKNNEMFNILRKISKMTQTEFAIKAGLFKQDVYFFERNIRAISLKKTIKLYKIFSLDISHKISGLSTDKQKEFIEHIDIESVFTSIEIKEDEKIISINNIEDLKKYFIKNMTLIQLINDTIDIRDLNSFSIEVETLMEDISTTECSRIESQALENILNATNRIIENVAKELHDETQGDADAYKVLGTIANYELKTRYKTPVIVVLH